MPGFADVHLDERDQLLAYLVVQRDHIRSASFGLSDAQARLTPSASALSISGIVKHLTGAEAVWIDTVAGRARPFDRSAYEEGFRPGPEESLAHLLERYAEVAAETEAVVGSLPVDHPVPVPEDVPWFPKDLEAWPLRWVLLHLIEETARHAGHADIVRESIDGATWLPLMYAAEGLPSNLRIKAWEPTGT